MKRTYIVIAAIVALALVAVVYRSSKKGADDTATPTPTPAVSTTPSITGAATDKPGDPKNATYDFGEGNTITLVNGTTTLTSGTETAIVSYADNDAKGDMDGDGKADTAFIMTAKISNGANFSIIAMILASEGGTHHVLPFFLGNDIKLQSTAISAGTLSVSYLEHEDPSDTTTPPTVQVTKRLKLQDGQFVEVVPAP